jgi:CheY-like chemotaxis protein
MTDALADILVVDDDTFTAELTGLILESAGYGTIIAEGGVDALEKLSADPSLSAVVSDMNMPLLDGIQLFAELRRLGFRQPFVLLTGEAAEPLRASHPGMDAVLTKDERLEELLPKTVAALLAAEAIDE